MTDELIKKRDELAVRPKGGNEGTTRYYSEEFREGFNAAHAILSGEIAHWKDSLIFDETVKRLTDESINYLDRIVKLEAENARLRDHLKVIAMADRLWNCQHYASLALKEADRE